MHKIKSYKNIIAETDQQKRLAYDKLSEQAKEVFRHETKIYRYLSHQAKQFLKQERAALHK